jgi:CRP/FNR family transcriptional regulator, anaerobic regulatory protein
MHDSLLHIIAQKVIISDNERQLCQDYFEPVRFSKNSILEREGKIPNYLYFVVSGYVRLFYVNDKGEENTSHINCPPGFITTYFNFINQTKATENVACVTDCTLLRIPKKNLDFIMSESEVLKDFSISVFQQSIAYNENRSKELATMTAEQRYKNLITHNPAMLHHVPILYIASFLGMKPESLSRIRRQIIS